MTCPACGMPILTNGPCECGHDFDGDCCCDHCIMQEPEPEDEEDG